MNRTIHSPHPRREFLSCAFLGITGHCLSRVTTTRLGAAPQVPQILPEEPTALELEVIEKSHMAKEIDDYFGKGYSCAESLLMVGLRHLRLPEELVWVAAGFGGGLQHREACGFLTGGIMNLGLAAGQLEMQRREAKEWSRQGVNAYWSWWTAQAPLRCAEIRREGTSSRVCRRLGLLAAAEVERLITDFQAPTVTPRNSSPSARTSGLQSASGRTPRR